MLKNLPLEVLENLCLYVRIEDLVNVWDAIEKEGSDSFWKTVCKKQDYKKMIYENSSWKNVFLRNINWHSQQYVKRTYRKELNMMDARQTSSKQNKELLLGKHLIVNTHGEETLVWDLSSSPNVVQSLSVEYITHKGNKLLTYNSSEVAVYSYDTQALRKIYELPVDLPPNSLKFCSITDNHLVAFDKNTSNIKIVDLRESTELSLKISVTMSRFFSLTLSNNFLFILIVEESNYKIKRFSLIDKIWLKDLVLFQCAMLIGVPQLEISSNLIVSWSNQLEGSGITPVKIFGLDGKYISSLPFVSCVESSKTEITKPVKNILWMIVECDYLIFSTSKSTVSIWSPENMNFIKVISKEDKLYNGQKVVSNSLLVLSYCYCFKVIDFKKSIYLYEVILDKQCLHNSFQTLTFFANEYFYIHLQHVEEGEGNAKLSTNKMLPLASSLCFNCDSKDISNKECYIHIYDFSRTDSSS